MGFITFLCVMGRSNREPLTKKEEELLRAMGKMLRGLRKDVAGFNSMKAFARHIHMDRALYGRYEIGANMKTLSLEKLLTHHNMKLDEYFSNVNKIIDEDKNEN